MYNTATLQCKTCHWLRVVNQSLHMTLRNGTDQCPMCESKEFSITMGYDTDELFEQLAWRVTTFEPPHIVEETLKRNADMLRIEFLL